MHLARLVKASGGQNSRGIDGDSPHAPVETADHSRFEHRLVFSRSQNQRLFKLWIHPIVNL
jgi:hypothetical protein